MKWCSQFDYYSSEFKKYIYFEEPQNISVVPLFTPLCCLCFKKCGNIISNVNKSLEFSNTRWTTDASMAGGLIFKRLQGGYWPPRPFLDVKWGARHFLKWVSPRWPSENTSMKTRQLMPMVAVDWLIVTMLLRSLLLLLKFPMKLRRVLTCMPTHKHLPVQSLT